ncbi:MAG: 16S rRNA (cytosine(1402)-N(4))-methyltransferase RsmH [Clostridia bacterium]|nr:16S rRNA (cytosine(1402)-N(4))-methyltransferase RsmH [Clostridia bacterium]
MEFQQGHIPVLFEETISLLNLKEGATVVDGTFGGGGHAAAILSAIGPDGLLIAIDRDEAAIARAHRRFGDVPNVRIVHANFGEIQSVLGSLGLHSVDGVLLDLGVSSYQLEDADRGFSYMQDAKLDMRMDRTQQLDAAEVVNTYPREELAEIIRGYGEERWADRIAEFIVREREKHPIQTTSQLVSVIKAAIPHGARRDGPHPAKRTFQAIRIEVNNELRSLPGAIADCAEVLRPGGRLAVITFHSLEDRIVKQEFRRLADPCECPKDFPVCVCGRKPVVRIITRKPVEAPASELEENPRARSAKLRVAERI